MTALVDTNVVLDVLLAREPFLMESASVLDSIERSRCRGVLCASSVTTIHYILRRAVGTRESVERMRSLFSIFEVAVVNRSVLETAMATGMADYEDAVIHQAAVQSGATCVVTRNVLDFKKAKLPVYTPSQFLRILGLEEKRNS